MIGMVNVPCDTPIDFYAGAPNHADDVEQTCSNTDDVSRTQQRRKPSYRPLFIGIRNKIEYAEDGRKLSNGVLLERSDPNKLWEELLLRSIAYRFEEEIQSPVESYKTLETELEKLNIKDKSLYRSTYSLVSQNRVEGTDFKQLEDKNKKKHKFSTNFQLLPFKKLMTVKKVKDEKITEAS